MKVFRTVLASCGIALAMAPAAGAIVTTYEAGTGMTILSNVSARPSAGIVIGNTAPGHVHASAQRREIASGATVPGNFPRVAAADQAARDSDRKKILQDELAAELQALQAAAERGEHADTLHRYDSNVAALRRELAALH